MNTGYPFHNDTVDIYHQDSIININILCQYYFDDYMTTSYDVDTVNNMEKGKSNCNFDPIRTTVTTEFTFDTHGEVHIKWVHICKCTE